MLTLEQRLDNKKRFVDLLTRLEIDVVPIVHYLDGDRADYFNKPFSTYQGHAYAGSLCERSLKLYDALTDLCEHYCLGTYSEKDIITVALLKDIYRAEIYEPYNRNIKNEETGIWETVVGYRNRENKPVFGDIGSASHRIVTKFFPVDDDEVYMAMCYSGISINVADIYNIRKAYNLVTLTTMAEFKVEFMGV